MPLCPNVAAPMLPPSCPNAPSQCPVPPCADAPVPPSQITSPHPRFEVRPDYRLKEAADFLDYGSRIRSRLSSFTQEVLPTEDAKIMVKESEAATDNVKKMWLRHVLTLPRRRWRLSVSPKRLQNLLPRNFGSYLSGFIRFIKSIRSITIYLDPLDLLNLFDLLGRLDVLDLLDRLDLFDILDLLDL